MDASSFDMPFFLNMSTAPKVERIVDKVKQLSGITTDTPFPDDWFENITDPETDTNFPFFPFSALAITGTAGAGKTASIQVLSSNLQCLCSGSTLIASQNLTTVLNRSKMAQVRTIYKEIGFSSKHVPMSNRESNIQPTNIQEKQRRDLSIYWTIISDIVSSALDNRDKMKSIPMCKNSVIIIDESGVMLEHMLQTVVFFYWFYNALANTEFYERRVVPCIVCVGSPTQTEALQTTFDHVKQNNVIRRGRDVLSSLICDPILSEYCTIYKNWILFISNKRCSDPDFGNLLKHIEFGLPITQEHISYVDRFVRPGNFIKDPQNAMDMTRLFISHQEVKDYYKRLHGQLLLSERRNLLFSVPTYCIINENELEEYKCAVEQPFLTADTWFECNKSRIWNYSQFADQDLSNTTKVWTLQGNSDDRYKILQSDLTYIKHSAVAVSSKLKCCIVGFENTYDVFIEILQKDTFLEITPYEQISQAYSFLNGLLYSGMFGFYTYGKLNDQILKDLRDVHLPDIDILKQDCITANIAATIATETLNAAVVSDPVEDYTDELLCEVTNLYNDLFYEKYKQPVFGPNLNFEETSFIYTVFKDIYIQRYNILQKHTHGAFGKETFVAYNRNNVSVRATCEIVSHTKFFSGLLSFTSPVRVYTLQGFTKNDVLCFSSKSNLNALEMADVTLPRLVLKDALGFLNIIEHNISHFSDTANNSSFELCTAVDYGVTPKIAMTITKSQGLSLDKVAVFFGDNPKNLKLNQIYVALSRVTNPENLIININPLRINYEKNNHITKFIVMALKNPHTYLVY